MISNIIEFDFKGFVPKFVINKVTAVTVYEQLEKLPLALKVLVDTQQTPAGDEGSIIESIIDICPQPYNN